MTRISNLICLFFLLARVASSQSFKEDIISVNKTMSQLRNYSVKLHYNLYLDYKLTTPFQSRIVSFKQNDDQISIEQAGEYDLIESKNDLVSIDHLNKMITYTNYGEGNEHESEVEFDDSFFKFFADKFDSISSNIDKVLTHKVDSDHIIYDVIYKSGEYNRILFHLDIGNKLFKSITAFYREKRTVDESDQKRLICVKVDYEDFEKSPSFSKDTFASGKYVVKTAGGYQLTKNYKQYTLKIL